MSHRDAPTRSLPPVPTLSALPSDSDSDSVSQAFSRSSLSLRGLTEGIFRPRTPLSSFFGEMESYGSPSPSSLPENQPKTIPGQIPGTLFFECDLFSPVFALSEVFGKKSEGIENGAEDDHDEEEEEEEGEVGPSSARGDEETPRGIHESEDGIRRGGKTLADSDSDSLSGREKQVFSEFVDLDSVNLSPLTSFHLFLYIRGITISQRLQDMQHRFVDLTTKKEIFRQIPYLKKKSVEAVAEGKLESQKLLEKAMARRDDRRGRGLFAKFVARRYEAVHRVLTRIVVPGYFKVGIEIESCRSYLISFGSNQANEIQARAHAMLNLLFVAIGTGSLSDFMSFLRVLTSFNPTSPFCTVRELASPTSSSSGEAIPESGIRLAADDLNVIRTWNDWVQENSSEEEGSWSAHAIELLRPGNVSVDMLFFFVLSRIDAVVSNVLFGEKSLFELELPSLCAGFDASIDAARELFETVLFFLEQVTLNADFQRSADLPQEKRGYLVSVLIKILRLNLEVVAQWKDPSETLDVVMSRLRSEDRPGLFKEVQDLLFHIRLLPDLPKEVSLSCCRLISNAFGLFYPTAASQRDFLTSRLSSWAEGGAVDVAEASIVRDVLRNLALDTTLLAWMIEELADGFDGLMGCITRLAVEISPDAVLFDVLESGILLVAGALDYLASFVCPSISRFLKKNGVGLDSPHAQRYVSLVRVVFGCAEKMISVLKSSRRGSSKIAELLLSAVHGVVRLLWRGSETSPFYAPFISLLDPITDVLKSVGPLVSTEIVPEYVVVETEHPYALRTDEKIDVAFSQQCMVSSAIFFHPMCRTAQESDFLVIQPGAGETDVSPLKLSGSGKKIPVDPLACSRKDLSLSFMSGEMGSDWGMKCYVTPIAEPSLFSEIERSLAWISGRLRSYLFDSSRPRRSPSLARWLEGSLFGCGIARDPAPGTALSFCRDFLADFVAKSELAGRFVEFIDGRLRMESFVGVGNDDILSSELVLVAALMKHCDLVPFALAFARKLSLAEDPRSLRMSIPIPLLHLWRSVRDIRVWMMQEKQKGRRDYGSLRGMIFLKAEFLLRLNQATFLGCSDEDIIVLGSGTGDVLAVSEKVLALGGEEEVLRNIESLARQVLSFCRGRCDLDLLKAEILRRGEELERRQKAVDHMIASLSSSSAPMVMAEHVREMSVVLKSQGLQSFRECEFHFLNGLSGCPRDSVVGLQSSITKLFGIVLSGNLATPAWLGAGLTRSVLSILSISFRLGDIDWIFLTSFLDHVTPLLQQNVASEDQDFRFRRVSSLENERMEVNMRAWKVFRLLSIRCVRLLEMWESGSGLRLPLEQRAECKTRLDRLRSRIFDTVFSHFEELIRSRRFVSSVLTEMLSLLVALIGSDASTGRLLQTSKLQEMILPLLGQFNHQVQQLSLKLYSLMVFVSSSKSTETASPEFMDRLISVVVDLLARFELTRCLSSRTFSEAGARVGLSLAKECFSFLRRLLNPSSPPSWRARAHARIKFLTHSAAQSLQSFVDAGRRSMSKIPAAVEGVLIGAVGAFVVVSGLSYLPRVGDIVSARLYGRWEDVEVVSVSESRHNVEVVLTRSSGIDRAQKVNSEDLRVFSNVVVDVNWLEPSEKEFGSLSSLIRTYGTLLLGPEADSYSENFHLFWSSLWKMALKCLHSFVSRNVNSGAYLSVFPDLVSFSKTITPTTYGEELKLHSCTFTYTGHEPATQFAYSCQTCAQKMKAICVFCAMNCHRGHQLGPVVKGNFVCDCGSAVGTKCISKVMPPKDPPLTLWRMDSLFQRIRSVLPIAVDQNEKIQDSFLLSPADQGAEFNAPSRFVCPSGQNGYVINDDEISFSWGNARGFSLIRSDYPVPMVYSGGYYFEVEIVRAGDRKGGIGIGFGQRENLNQPWPQVLDASFTFHVRSGHVYRGMRGLAQQPGFVQTVAGDVFGAGWSRSRKEVFFTKNGKLLPVILKNVVESDLFATLLLRGENACVNVNLGKMGGFRYNVQKSLQVSQDGQVPTSPVPRIRCAKISLPTPEECLRQRNLELLSLGYNQTHVKEALSHYTDLNAAAAFLHLRAMKPQRFLLSDRLMQMGFDRPLAIKALEVNNDDVNQALNWLLEERHVGANQQVSQNRGVPFLGSNVDAQAVKELTMKGVLISHTRVNDNAFPPIRCGHTVAVKEVVVALSPEPLAGRLGVVIRKLQGGAYVRCVDSDSGNLRGAFVPNKDIVVLPSSLRGVKLDGVAVGCIKLARNIGTLYCRKILECYLSRVDVLPIDRTFGGSESLYEILGVLFMKQYHTQHHTFVANVPDLDPTLERLMDHLENVEVVVQGQPRGSVFDTVAGCALRDLTVFQERMPFHRKIIFDPGYNGRRIQIRFWGCSAIFFSFSRRCVLPTQYDFLSFYYGERGDQVEVFAGAQKPIPRNLVLPGDRFWFEFRCPRLTKDSGFQFHVTPVSFRKPERLAILQPNVALASLVLRSASNAFWRRSIALAKKTFEISINYLMTPFAPFKGSVGNAVESLIAELFNSDSRPNLMILKTFRMELEDLHISFMMKSKTTDQPLPIFHSLVELMSIFRYYLSTDLCRGVFAYQDNPSHMYTFRLKEGTQMKEVVACPSCAMNENLKSNVPFYRSHSFEKCQLSFSNDFAWKLEEQRRDYSNLLPIRSLQVNPAEWFDHSSWIDQLTIVRGLLTILVGNKSLPGWFLYEASVETRRQLVPAYTSHPYAKLDFEGEIHIPGAHVLLVTFDRRSELGSCDSLCFSAKQLGGAELGSLKGTEMSGRTFVIRSDRLFYRTKCDGGEHKCVCLRCRRPIVGVRYRCSSPECDRFDLCQNCIDSKGVHPDHHVFLKLRRPVSCQPASCACLYTQRWSRSRKFRGKVHHGVRCNGCGVSPIRGIRFMCENCREYNLCSRCSAVDYRFHNRKHVFLRIVRPLPEDRSQFAPNHLPYGLIYEKENDNAWGISFTVTTPMPSLLDDRDVQVECARISDAMEGFNLERDAQLVQYVEDVFGSEWESKSHTLLSPTKSQLMNFPLLSGISVRSLQYRFLILKLFNRKLARVIHLCDLETATTELAKSYTNISTLIALSRRRIFTSIKSDVWENTLAKTFVKRKRVDLTVDRQLAADAKSLTNKLAAATDSLFNQCFTQLQSMNPKCLSRNGASWRVTLKNESADDYGGPFRESLSQMCAELQSDQLDLFIRVPNSRHGVGENREKFIPNPRARSFVHMKWFRFVGILMGVGMLSKNVLSLDLPSMFWKQFVKEKVGLSDLQGIDQMVVQSMENLRTIHLKGIDETTFGDVIMEKFTTRGSDGIEVELVRGGMQRDVTFASRDEYAELVEEMRLREFEDQVTAIRQGLFSIVPSRFSPLFAWNDLEVLICGKRTIDIELLKSHSVYELYTEASPVVVNFWKVLESFNSRERSMYLRFVWGRTRLPISEEGFTHPHKIQKLERPKPDEVFPLSHTCFFSIELPEYSSFDIMRERILYAITNCRAIDTDATRNARNALNMS